MNENSQIHAASPVTDNPYPDVEPIPDTMRGLRNVYTKHIKITVISLLVLVAGLTGGLFVAGQSQDTRSRASDNGPALSLSPAVKSLTVGQTASVGILLNTGTDTVSAVELHLTYDPAAVEISGFNPAPSFPVVLKPAEIGNGTVSVVLGAQPTTPLKGAGIIGAMTIKSLSKSQSDIRFAPTTLVASLGKNSNTLSSSAGMRISGIQGGVPLSVKNSPKSSGRITEPVTSVTPEPADDYTYANAGENYDPGIPTDTQPADPEMPLYTVPVEENPVLNKENPGIGSTPSQEITAEVLFPKKTTGRSIGTVIRNFFTHLFASIFEK